MKKTLFFASILATVCAMTSCIKGDDLEMLKHPVHLEGHTIDPRLGIPVVYGELDMNDILSKLGNDYEGYIEPDSTIITLNYQTQFDSVIEVNINPMGKKSPARKAGLRSRAKDPDHSNWLPVSKWQQQSVSIDFFKKVTELGNIEFDAIWLDITANARAEFSNTDMANHVEVSFDSIELAYVPMGSVVPQYKSIPDTIMLNNLIAGETKQFKRINLADVVNSAPTAIQVRFRLNLRMDPDYVTEMIEAHGFDYWLNNMDITKFYYGVDLKVIMPLSVGISGMQYDFDVSLGQGIKSINLDSILNSINEGIHAEFDSSILTMSMDNGIPLNINLSAVLCDSLNNEVNNLFTNQMIKSAKVMTDPNNPTRWEAVDTTNTIIKVRLNNDQLNDLTKAKKLKLRMVFDSNGKHVDIKTEDLLYMKAYLMVDPNINIDITLMENGIL